MKTTFLLTMMMLLTTDSFSQKEDFETISEESGNQCKKPNGIRAILLELCYMFFH